MPYVELNPYADTLASCLPWQQLTENAAVGNEDIDNESMDPDRQKKKKENATTQQQQSQQMVRNCSCYH